jgi:hypothetical protein
MNRIQKIAVGVALTGSTLAGGALGAALLNGSANAQTSTTAPGATSTAPVDKSNNDAAHEAAETPAHEADETAGKVGGGGHGDHVSNKDPAHEAAESPARAAEEASRDAAIANGSSTTTPGSPTTSN